MLENATMKMTSVIGALTLATMLVACPPPPAILVSLTPNTAQSVYQGQSVSFSAAVVNAQNTAVIWTISPTGVGTFTPNSNSATYTAPAAVSAPSSLLITARSFQDNSKIATTTISLLPLVAVALTPSTSQTLESGQQVSLTAVVNSATNPAVVWTATPTGVGTLTPNGNSVTYVAPNPITVASTVVLKATSTQDASKSSSISVNLQPPVVSRVTIQGSTTTRSIAINTQVQFSATVQGVANQSVAWSIVEGATRGSIDTNGNYTAPATVPNPASATIKATSVADPSLTGTFQLTIVASGGISGTVTLGVGLLNAPRIAMQNAPPQAAANRQLQADWQAKRTQGEVLLIAKAGLSLQSLSAQSPTLRSTSTKLETGFLRVKVPSGQSDQTFAQQLALETGALVQPNYLYHLLDAPNDLRYPDQANLTQIDAPGAWATQISVPDGLIAVIDSGINANHPDLAGRVILGKDFCPTYSAGACQGEDNDPSEITTAQGGIGHGTFATGIIAAATNNQAGIAGITQSGKVLSVKVFGFDAGGAVADTIALSKGIRYAADQNAKVLSMSLGVCSSQTTAFETPDKLTENAINYAVSRGVVLVAASGNNGVSGGLQCGTDTAVQFPSSNPNVISVGSVNSSNLRSSFSAAGAALDLVAPGEALLSLDFATNAYKTLSGTSFAAPQVAAVAGLMLAKKPTLTRDQVKIILESAAKDLGSSGRDNETGAGLLQAGAALSAVANPGGSDVKTSIYLYADRLLDTPNAANGCPVVLTADPDCYDGAGPLAGRAVVTISGTTGAVAYSITLSRNTQALQAGTYRVTACVNKNSNATACDPGDLGIASNLNLQFNGTSLPNINLNLEQL